MSRSSFARLFRAIGALLLIAGLLPASATVAFANGSSGHGKSGHGSATGQDSGSGHSSTKQSGGTSTPASGDPLAAVYSGNITDTGNGGAMSCFTVTNAAGAVSIAHSAFTYSVDKTNTYLSITSLPSGWDVLGIAVKGGDAFNWYSAASLDSSNWNNLHAPLAGQSGAPAQISHWVACGVPTSATPPPTPTLSLHRTCSVFDATLSVSSSAAGLPASYVVQTSTDKSTWTDRGSVTLTSTAPSATVDLTGLTGTVWVRSTWTSGGATKYTSAEQSKAPTGCTPPPPPTTCTAGPFGATSFVYDYHYTDGSTSGWTTKVGGMKPFLTVDIAYKGANNQPVAMPAPCSQPFGLVMYDAQGPTWSTSGQQTYLGSDIETLTSTAGKSGITLTVPAPTSCAYQEDLYLGNTVYNGVDGALPHYDNSVTPKNNISYSNGWTSGYSTCFTVTPPTCVTAGSSSTGLSITNLSASAVDVTVGSVKTSVAAGTTKNVSVPWTGSGSYMVTFTDIVGGKTVATVTTEQPGACPVTTPSPSGALTAVACSGATPTVSGTHTGGDSSTAWVLKISGDTALVPVPASSPFTVSVPARDAGSTIELGYLSGATFTPVASTEMTVPDCGQPQQPTQPSGSLSTACGSPSSVRVTALSDGSYSDVAWRLVEGTAVSGRVLTYTPTVGAAFTADSGAIYTLAYSIGEGSLQTAASIVAAGTCPVVVNPNGTLILSKAVSPTGTVEIDLDAPKAPVLTYTLTATATGSLTQHNVVITDVLPGYLSGQASGKTTYVAGSAKCLGAGACSAAYQKSSETVSWAIGDLAAGTSRSVTFQVSVVIPATVGSLTIVNTAAATSTETHTTSNVVSTPITAVQGIKIGKPSGGVLPHTGAGLPVGWAVLLSAVLLGGGAGLILTARRLAARRG